jgi:hypothetical protein
MRTITIGSNSYRLFTMPSSPGPASVEIAMQDTVATLESPFTKRLQTQNWPGADWWEGTITLPPMTVATAGPWEAFLAALQGQLNVFQAPDWRRQSPLGNAIGSVPTVAAGNTALANTLITSGWKVGAGRVLLPGDRFSLGYRYYMVAGDEPVTPAANGNATFTIWPSLREVPATGTALVLNAPKVLLRLASNRRALQWSPRRLTTMSFPVVEVR